MRKIFLLTVLALSCSESEHPTEVLLRDGLTCLPTEVEGGVTLACPKSEPVFIADGSDGLDGGDSDCDLKVIDGSLVAVCQNQSYPINPQGTLGTKGETGPKGDKGDKGDKGNDGASCTLEEDSGNCIWLVCGSDRKKIYNPNK